MTVEVVIPLNLVGVVGMDLSAVSTAHVCGGGGSSELWCACCVVLEGSCSRTGRGALYTLKVGDEVRETVKTTSGVAVSDREPAAAVCCLRG